MAAGLGGNGGGNPLAGMDLGSLMSNPAIMNMAQQFMKSGAYDEMMKDPSKMMDMAQNFMGNQDNSNGENPLASLMNDPKVAKMAEQFKNGNFGNPPKKE
ncbi:hypothetical protein K502DRAFT_250823 [Neoconidiobolus thromboides FSU 785]|nr:hypothetical protein K502DRAFT_250823 [Neoconidiobolus thromboides FSU 785]